MKYMRPLMTSVFCFCIKIYTMKSQKAVSVKSDAEASFTFNAIRYTTTFAILTFASTSLFELSWKTSHLLNPHCLLYIGLSLLIGIPPNRATDPPWWFTCRSALPSLILPVNLMKAFFPRSFNPLLHRWANSS